VKKFWRQLYNYKIVQLTGIDSKNGRLQISFISKEENSYPFEEVIVGYFRMMLLYEEMVNNYPTDDFKIEILGQSILILLVGTLESYLTSLFYELCRFHKIKDIDEKFLLKYFNNFNINLKLRYNEIQELSLLNFIPKKLRFQEKDFIKNAFLLFGITINELNHELWKTLFDKEKGYVRLRHRLIHRGPMHGLYKENRLDLEFTEEIMLKFAAFFELIDNYILNRYPQLSD
jgi:hypothetical protein